MHAHSSKTVQHNTLYSGSVNYTVFTEFKTIGWYCRFWICFSDIDSKANFECNASATVILRCSLTPQGSPVNPVKWFHHFKNRTIRSLQGDISGSNFTLTLPFCNYQDIGSYSCVWNTSSELIHKHVIVSVNGMY